MRALILILVAVTFIQGSRAGDDPTPEQTDKFVREALQHKTPVTNYDKPLVPTAEVAVAIHKAIATGIYGRESIGQEPFHAARSGEYWVVYGALPRDTFGGVPITVIRASDAKIMYVTISGQKRLTRRWSERRTAVRSTFEMTSTHPLRAKRALVRRRSSCSR